MLFRSGLYTICPCYCLKILVYNCNIILSLGQVTTKKSFCHWENKEKTSLVFGQPLNNISEKDCLIRCVRLLYCQALNYHRSTRQCILGAADQALLEGELVNSYGVVHYTALRCHDDRLATTQQISNTDGTNESGAAYTNMASEIENTGGVDF